MSNMKKLARILAEQSEQYNRQSITPQLTASSLEDGAIDEYDSNGNLVGSYGKQWDGSHMGASLGGPTPPTPVAPTTTVTPGVLTVRWNGYFERDAVSTMDHKHVAVDISPSAEFPAETTQQIGVIKGEMGDSVTVSIAAGTYFVRLVTWTLPGKRSAPSVSAVAVVPLPTDADAVREEMERVDSELEQVNTDLGTLDNTLTETNVQLGQAKQDLITAKTELEAADEAAANRQAAFDARQDTFQADMTAAVGRISTAETVLAPLPGDVATAKQEATDAADAARAAEARATEANNRAMTRLANGNFEQGLLYWNTSTGITLADEGHSGAHSALVNASRLEPDSLMPVVENQIWELQYYFKAHTPEAVGDQVYACMVDSSGAVVSEYWRNFEATEEWKNSGSLRFTVPADVDMIRPRIARSSQASTLSEWLIDDVVVRDVTDVVRLETAANSAAAAASDASDAAHAIEVQLTGIQGDLDTAKQDIIDARTEAQTNLGELDTALRTFAEEEAAEAKRLALEGAAADALSKYNSAMEAVRQAQATAANIFPDPGFESGEVGDSVGDEGWVISDAQVHGGVRSAKFAGSAGAITRIWLPSKIQVSKGQTWRFSVWVLTSPDWDGTVGNAKIRLTNQTGANISLVPFVNTNGAWQLISVERQIQDEDQYLTGYFSTDQTQGEIYLDDVVIADVTNLKKLEAEASEIKRLAEAAQTAADSAQTTANNAQSDATNAKNRLATLEDTTLPQLRDDLDDASTALGTLNTETLPDLNSALDAARGRLNTIETTDIPGLKEAIESVANVAENGSFENGDAGWKDSGSPNQYQITNELARTGSFSLKTNGETRISYPVKGGVTDGQTWRYSVWYNSPEGTDFSSIKFGFTRGQTSWLKSTILNGSQGATDGWVQYTGEYTIPAGSGLTDMAFRIGIGGSSSSKVAYFDDLEITNITEVKALRDLTGGWTKTGTTQIDGGKIFADSVRAAQIDTLDIAAAVATVIQLNADRITAGTINTDRLSTNTIAARVATVISLNADRITAGKISTARLDAVAVAALTADFQTVRTDNIRTGTAVMDTGVAKKLFSDLMVANKITARHMTISDSTNLAPGGGFDSQDDLDNWDSIGSTSVYSIDSTVTASNSGGSLKVTGASGIQQLYTRFPVVPGDKIKIMFSARNTSTYNGTAGNGKLRVGNQAGSLLTNYTWQRLTPDQFSPEEREFTVPSGVTQLQINLVFDHTAGAVWVDDLEIRRMTSGKLIVDGAITATKITVDGDLISKFFAADRALVETELVVNGRLFADNADIISAAMQTLTVTEKANFADAFAEQFAANEAFINNLTATEAWIGGVLIKDGQITAPKIVSGAITTEKIDALAVNADKIATNAVTADKIIANAITAAKISTGAITAGKIAATAFVGQKFTGGTFTGALFQSSETLNSGMKLDAAGLKQYGIDPDSGVGYVTSVKDGWNGPGLFFETLSGSNLGTISASSSADFPGLAMIGPGPYAAPSRIDIGEMNISIYSGRTAAQYDTGTVFRIGEGSGAFIGNLAGGGLTVYESGVVRIMGDRVEGTGTWTNVPYYNNWNTQSGFNRLRARKEGDRVFLEGRVLGGTANATIGILPAGLRPPRTQNLRPLTYSGSNTLNDSWRLDITTTGAIYTAGWDGTYISFDGISFPLS